MSEQMNLNNFFADTFRQAVREELNGAMKIIDKKITDQVTPPLRQTISLSDLEKRLGIKAIAIHNLRREGAFRGCKIAGKWRFYEYEIVAYIEQEMMKVED